MTTVMITVRGMPQTCWKCGAASRAVVALHPEQDHRLESACWHGDEPALALAKEMLTAAGRRDIAEQLRERYSRTAQTRYLCNGCHRCSALFGAYYLNDEILETAAANGASLDEFPALLTAPVSAARWTALVEARSSVIG